MRGCSEVGKFLGCPLPCLQRLELDFAHVEMDSSTPPVCCYVTNFWASASRGHRWVKWSSMHKLQGYLTFHFSVFSLPTLSLGFLSPLPFFRCFFFPSGCWVAFGLVDCTVCTSDVLVGGVAKAVVWLAAVCCMDNYCSCFVNCSTGLVCAETTIPSACGPTLCLVLSSIECGALARCCIINRTENR
jgi:hypothetical protein